MRSVILAAAIAASTIILSSEALAQCAFDGPAKAKSMKASLIRVFARCPYTSFPAPNSSTGTGVPSCSPPFAPSSYEFDDRKGACRLSTKSSVEDPCPNDFSSSDPCMVMTLKLKCSGVLNPGGTTPTNDPGFALNVIIRATIDDPQNGDMTAIDFPVQFALQSKDGKVTAGPQSQLLSAAIAGPPPCSELEILHVAVQDPDGNPFATWGAGTR